jgi:hypothetical protein
MQQSGMTRCGELVALRGRATIEDCCREFAGFFDGGTLEPFKRACCAEGISTVAGLCEGLGKVYANILSKDEFNARPSMAWAVTLMAMFGVEPASGWDNDIVELGERPRSAVVLVA